MQDPVAFEEARRPVLVGISQLLQRDAEPADALTPLELMIDAVREAARDAEAPELLRRASSVRVVRGVWGYANPAKPVRDAIGCPSAQTGLSVLGGNHVQMMLNRSALEIQAGEHDVIILTGAECGRTMGRASKAGVDLTWLAEKSCDDVPDVSYGDERWTRHEVEMACGLERPVQYYSLFENALRFARGESIPDHLERLGGLWSRFSEAAGRNPNAWIREPKSAQEILTVTARNRAISFPYPLLMNANMRVDMGAALILCAQETADALAIPRSKRVYPMSGTDAYDHYFVSERENLHSSPAIRIAGAKALELAETETSELDAVDLYSCFPSAVQVAARELGLDEASELTTTGGLTFGGGPLNNYVMHSIARTAELLREKPGARGLVTANGGMLTKHSIGVYSSAPPSQAFRHADLQEEVDATPRTGIAVEVSEDATIESYAVMFGSTGKKGKTSYTSIYGQRAPRGNEPSIAHLACRLDDRRRTWANVEEPELLAAMCNEEFCGRRVRLNGAADADVV